MTAVSLLSRTDKLELIRLLEEKARREKGRAHLIQYKTLYDWQLRFVRATAEHTSAMLMSANRVGKTRTGLTIDALHLLGEYPEGY